MRYSLFISRRQALEGCRTSSALILPYGLLKSLQLFMFPIWKIDIIFSYLDYRSPLNSLVSYQCATVCSRLPPTSSFSLAITPNFYGCNWQWNSHLFQTMLNFIWQLIAPHSYGPQKKWSWPNMKCSFSADKWKLMHIKRNNISWSYIMLNLHYVVCFHSGNKLFTHPEFSKINNSTCSRTKKPITKNF